MKIHLILILSIISLFVKCQTYVKDGGTNSDSCGTSPENSCGTLEYIVNTLSKRWAVVVESVTISDYIHSYFTIHSWSETILANVSVGQFVTFNNGGSFNLIRFRFVSDRSATFVTGGDGFTLVSNCVFEALDSSNNLKIASSLFDIAYHLNQFINCTFSKIEHYNGHGGAIECDGSRKIVGPASHVNESAAVRKFKDKGALLT
jgi:hypothetical protein